MAHMNFEILGSEERSDHPSNFMKRKVSIHEKEIYTIGSHGLWTIDLTRRTRKFGFQRSNEQERKIFT
jgi:hypothetical protein